MAVTASMGGPTPRGVAVRSMVPGPATGWMVGPGPTDQRGARQASRQFPNLYQISSKVGYFFMTPNCIGKNGI